MKVALLSLAFLGSQSFMTSQPITPISDSIPHLNVEVLCKATEATDQAMGLTEAQSFEHCLRDETEAQQQLAALWQASSTAVRNQCEGEAMAGDSQSYVDLLTCIQMTNDAKALSSAGPPLRGASKNRNKN
jgi:hypothetical protein